MGDGDEQAREFKDSCLRSNHFATEKKDRIFVYISESIYQEIHRRAAAEGRDSEHTLSEESEQKITPTSDHGTNWLVAMPINGDFWLGQMLVKIRTTD